MPYDFASESRSGSWGRRRHSRIAVRSFRYYRDPLFLGGCALYALNRWALKPVVSAAFFHNWFADVLLIPCALPPLLWLQSRLRLRSGVGKPSWQEISFHLVIWSLLFEVAGPFMFSHAVGDWRDVIAYVGGGLLAGCWWNAQR
jgi:hypothetical protein